MRKTKNNEDLMKIQAERLNNVLRELNLSQADIVKALEDSFFSINPQRMSDFINGKRLLTEDVLKGLKMRFFINDNYLKGKSEDMYDIPETILNYAFLFAKEITITENPHRTTKSQNIKSSINNTTDNEPVNERYLHIVMEKAFYEFLINLDLLESTKEKGTLDQKKFLYEIKEIYKNKRSNNNETEEYVLLPKNSLLNILKIDVPKEKKAFEELIDILDLSDSYTKCTSRKKLKLNQKTDNNN